MAFSIAVTRISVLVLLLILLCGHIIPSASENANLYRLKKLRNSFIEQVDEQVASNEELLESQYLTTVKDLVDRISQTIREAVEEITALQRNFVGMAPQCEASVTPRAMFTTADAALNACVSRAEENGASISEYVISEIERFQTKTTDFSLWFNEAFLSDWENDIFSSNHYHDVYDELEAKVLLWDNVESVELFRFRLEAIQRLNNLTATIDECTIQTKEKIATVYGRTLFTALMCR